jgi:hypothetical protein
MAKLLITMDYLGFFGGVISTNPAENASIPILFSVLWLGFWQYVNFICP